MIRDYSKIPTPVTTIDTSNWFAIRITGLTGLWIIANWIHDNKSELAGSFYLDGHHIFFQKEADIVFCKLTIDTNNG